MDNDICTILKENFKRICKDKKIKAKDVAKAIGVDASNLSSSLHNNPSLKRVKLVADTLGVTIGELLGEQPRSEKVVGYTNLLDGRTYKIVEF